MVEVSACVRPGQTRARLEHGTRPPLPWPKPGTFDLHALSTPPAFVLSQDQTLSPWQGSRLARWSFRSGVPPGPAALFLSEKSSLRWGFPPPRRSPGAGLLLGFQRSGLSTRECMLRVERFSVKPSALARNAPLALGPRANRRDRFRRTGKFLPCKPSRLSFVRAASSIVAPGLGARQAPANASFLTLLTLSPSQPYRGHLTQGKGHAVSRFERRAPGNPPVPLHRFTASPRGAALTGRDLPVRGESLESDTSHCACSIWRA